MHKIGQSRRFLFLAGITGNPLILPAELFSLMDSVEKELKKKGVKNKEIVTFLQMQDLFYFAKRLKKELRKLQAQE